MRQDRPRRLRLRKGEEKRIITILANVPQTEPGVTIGPYVGEPFPVEYREDCHVYVPLEVGAEGYYALYAPLDRHILEANYLRVARPVIYQRSWHLEVYVAGGGLMGPGERFEICYYYPRHYRREAHGRSVPGAYPSGSAPPLHLLPSTAIRWEDDQTATGPEKAEMLFAGYHTVTIGRHSYDCMRVIDIHREEVEGDGSHVKVRLPEDDDVWDGYVSRDGRTVFVRRFATEAWLAEQRRRDDASPQYRGSGCPVGDELAGVPRLQYYVVTFWHWHDILTSVALAPTDWQACRWGVPCRRR